MGLTDTITRLIRTWVPISIGALVANLPGLEGVIDSDALVAAVIAAYYGLAAWLETLHPAFGWLLGRPKGHGEVSASDTDSDGEDDTDN